MDEYALQTIRFRVRSLVRAGLVHSREQDDLGQDLALEYVRRKDAFDPRRGSPKTFVTAVIRNLAISALRQRRTRARAPNALMYALLEHPAVDACARPDSFELAISVAQVLRGLPPQLRVLAESLANENPTEISRRTGRCRTAVYGDIARLRTAFRESGLGFIKDRAGQDGAE